MELSSQEEVIKALEKEGFKLTQATLSRDLKQLKVAKAASMGGKYVYVLPNDSMYKRVSTPGRASEMLLQSGYLSIQFSGQMAIIKTRPGYASAIAYNLDNSDLPEVLGTIAGDDTIFIVFKEGCSHEEVLQSLSNVIPELQKKCKELCIGNQQLHFGNEKEPVLKCKTGSFTVQDNGFWNAKQALL